MVEEDKKKNIMRAIKEDFEQIVGFGEKVDI